MNEIMKHLDEELSKLRPLLSKDLGNTIIVKLKISTNMTPEDISNSINVIEKKLNKGSNKMFKVIPVYLENIKHMDFEIILSDSERIQELEAKIAKLEEKVKFLYS